MLIKILKYLFISFLFFFANFNAKSQTAFDKSEALDYSSLTVYDLFYLQDNVKKQEDLLNEVNKRIIFFQNNYYKTKRSLDVIQYRLTVFKATYANLIKAIFYLKSNNVSFYFFILSSESFNQAFTRYNYLKLLVTYLKQVTEYINLLKTEYTNTSNSMFYYKKSLEVYLENYQNKRRTIDTTVSNLIDQANLMKQKSDEIRITLKQDFNRYKVIEETIFKFSNNTEMQHYGFDSLIYPINNPVLISSFGVHSHPYLKDVQIKNDGVDLFSNNDTIVKCVSNGVVVAVIIVPQYGKSVIVKHNEYFSVYSNMNMIFVSNNDNVFKGQLLGSISKKTSKYSFPCLNLQIWHNTEKLNPEEFYDF